MDLISVIVPVYNVEEYLDRCVESIVNQTYANLEIILVDDGSPDNCPAMCDMWAQKDHRIKVIHKANGGLSSARNIGMQTAAGVYIAFVDSDDWLEHTFIEVLHELCTSKHADISACNVRFVDNEGNLLEQYIDQQSNDKLCSCQEAFKDIMHGIGFRATSWNKLYSRNIISGVQFPTDKIHEDEFFTNSVIPAAKKLAYTGKYLYNYVQNPHSLMRTKSMGHLDALDAHSERVLLFQNQFPELYLEDKVSLCIACSYHYVMILNGHYADRKQASKRIMKIRNQIRFSCSDFKKLTFKNKVYIWGTTRYCIAIFARLQYFKGLYYGKFKNSFKKAGKNDCR